MGSRMVSRIILLDKQPIDPRAPAANLLSALVAVLTLKGPECYE